MARQVNPLRLEEIGDAIEHHPEQRSGWYADQLGLDRKTLHRALVQLEAKGELLAEDDRGRISWFRRKK